MDRNALDTTRRLATAAWDKASLQESLLIHKQQFISKSRARVRHMKLRKEQRLIEQVHLKAFFLLLIFVRRKWKKNEPKCSENHTIRRSNIRNFTQLPVGIISVNVDQSTCAMLFVSAVPNIISYQKSLNRKRKKNLPSSELKIRSKFKRSTKKFKAKFSPNCNTPQYSTRDS